MVRRFVRVEEVMASHKTPVWNNVRPEQVPPLVAMQRYYAYAQQQFTISGTSVPAAAMALYGLGRLQSALSAEDSVKKMTAGPKAMALYRATLDIDPNNYLAANELGVLYGRYGQWNEAEASLRRSIAIAPRTENWHNLADVLDRMGNGAGANRSATARAVGQELGQSSWLADICGSRSAALRRSGDVHQIVGRRGPRSIGDGRRAQARRRGRCRGSRRSRRGRKDREEIIRVVR